MKITKADDLKKIKENGQKLLSPSDTRITVGAAMCGMAKGSGNLLPLIGEEVQKQGLTANVAVVGCNGMCYAEPIIEVVTGDDRKTYGNVTGPQVAAIVSAAKEGKAADGVDLLNLDEFESGQEKVVSKNSGTIAPGNIEEYIGADGYSALAKALSGMKPAAVLKEVSNSKLRGRGGAGFPAGIKWEACAKAEGEKKYIVCNGSEGDPEIGMHRSFLESDPHMVIEGMILAGFATGADEGYLYVNDRYMLGLKRVGDAIGQATEYGLLGENIMGSGFSFNLKVKRGGGAYVCGEETALLESIEGSVGEPRSKPPYPAEVGLFDKPTIVNNIETLANIPYIVNNGGSNFAKIGCDSSTGTKIIAFSGNVEQSCWVEVPLGKTVQEVIDTYGKGAKGGKKIKAYQIGGPSGGILPAEQLNLQLCYDALSKAGSLLGSGGLLVMDEDTDMLGMAQFFTDFFKEESCGKCTTCREATIRLKDILNGIQDGKGTQGHIDLIKRMNDGMSVNACCAPGKTAAVPIMSVIDNFPDEIVGKVK